MTINLTERFGKYHFDTHVELFYPPRIERLRQSTKVAIPTGKKAQAKAAAEALEVARERIRELKRRDKHGVQTQMMLYAGMDLYLSEYSGVSLRQWTDHSTIAKRLKGEYAKHPALPNMLISKLTTGHITSLVADRRRAGLAISTINKEIWFLSGALKWAKKHKAVDVPDIEWAEYVGKPFQKKRWATPDQLRDIYSHITMPIQQDIFILLVTTGARLGEILSLRWDQVSHNERTVLLERTKTEDNQETLLSLTDAAWQIIERRYQSRTTAYVFQHRQRDYPCPAAYPKQIAEGIQAAGLNDDVMLVRKKGKFTVHSLRDSFASLLLQSGDHTLAEIQELLGHSSPVMTQKYAHHIPNVVAQRAAQTIDGSLTGTFG